ncbi:MAG: DNRLRE domain-containing protein [bacterium]
MRTLSAQTQVNIPAGKDNTLYESSTGALSNGIGEYFFVGRVGASGGGLRRRGLIFFDIANNIPAGAIINSVSLRLNLSQTITGPRLIGLHRVLADWGQGTSNSNAAGGGQGASSTPGDATWRHRFFSTTLWTTLGGDFVATASATQTVLSDLGFFTWGSTSQMINDVQNWLNSPSGNFGWLLLGDESTTTTAKRFDTRENLNPALRPLLTVNYTATVAVKDNSSQPAAFALHENFPNPFTASAFNSATIIRYELPRNVKVNLVIYNLLGEKIRTLLDAPESAGSKQVIWNGAHDAGEKVASGIYIYRIEAGTFTATRKLTFIKN